jgi:hypothetical protein
MLKNPHCSRAVRIVDHPLFAVLLIEDESPAQQIRAVPGLSIGGGVASMYSSLISGSIYRGKMHMEAISEAVSPPPLSSVACFRSSTPPARKCMRSNSGLLILSFWNSP